MNNLKWGSISAFCALSISILLGIASGVSTIYIIARALIFTAVFFGIGFGLRFILDSFFPEVLVTSEEAIPPEINETDGHISIAMDGMGEYAVPELFNQGNSEELGNAEDLVSGAFKPRAVQDDFNSSGSQSEYPSFNFSMTPEGIDQKQEAGYNNSEELQDDSFFESEIGESAGFEKPEVNKQAAFQPAAYQPQFTPSFGDDSGLGGLPDLDMMAMAFSSNYSGTPAPAAPSVASVSAPAIHPVEDEPDRSQYKGNKPQTLQGNYDPKSLAQGIRTVLSKS